MSIGLLRDLSALAVPDNPGIQTSLAIEECFLCTRHPKKLGDPWSTIIATKQLDC